MPQKLYVGNLPLNTTEDAVRELFSQYGTVHSVKLITDRDTGQLRGFGFVEMDGASEAIQNLNGQEFEGRNLRVDEAQTRNDRPRRGGGGGGYRGGGGGGGGGRGRGGGGGGGRRW